MNEQEYQDKLKVRTQLSLADQFRVLEHEFQMLKKRVDDHHEIIGNMQPKSESPIVADGPVK